MNYDKKEWDEWKAEHFGDDIEEERKAPSAGKLAAFALILFSASFFIAFELSDFLMMVYGFGIETGIN